MMKLHNIRMEFKIILCFILLFGKSSGSFRRLFDSTNGPCEDSHFRCLDDDQCISKYFYCNGQRDCTDGSDEKYCRYVASCPKTYSFYKCQERKCIPSVWKCDGFGDCPRGDDESDCDRNGVLSRRSMTIARSSAKEWLYKQLKTDSSTTDRWGNHLKKISVALYLGDSSFQSSNGTRTEMAYELSVQLLSKFSFRKLVDVSSYDLASYTNALLVTCLDPRKFHSVNLVEVMRSRVDAKNYTNPYILLTLCNAGEKITEKDIQKLNQSFWNAHRELWTETQAIAVLALACAGNQPESSFNMSEIKNFTSELKKRQYTNGTVEDLKTTALVMQVLLASEPEDPNSFDEEKAMLQIIESQQKDGSFGNLLNTYYVMPILMYRTLANISTVHCNPYIKDEDTGLEDLMSHADPKMRIKYSMWIGKERDLERTLKMRVPSNISFYGVMEMAGDVDPLFRFQYVVKNGKPYVNAMYGKQDDAESEKFWFLYNIQGAKPVPLLQSPADLFPKDNDHIVMWYRSGTWIQ